jgi:hypothetical protein
MAHTRTFGAVVCDFHGHAIKKAQVEAHFRPYVPTSMSLPFSSRGEAKFANARSVNIRSCGEGKNEAECFRVAGGARLKLHLPLDKLPSAAAEMQETNRASTFESETARVTTGAGMACETSRHRNLGHRAMTDRASSLVSSLHSTSRCGVVPYSNFLMHNSSQLSRRHQSGQLSPRLNMCDDRMHLQDAAKQKPGVMALETDPARRATLSRQQLACSPQRALSNLSLPEHRRHHRFAHYLDPLVSAPFLAPSQFPQPSYPLAVTPHMLHTVR